MFDRRLVENFDWGLLLLILSLMGIGLLNIYSAVMAGNPDGVPHLFYRQIMWYGIGAGIMCVMMLFHYKLYEQWGLSIFVGCILLLVMLFFVGKYVGGSRRWLALGPLTLQPSELMKLGTIIMMARYYARNVSTLGMGMVELVRPFILVMIPFFLIVQQPDLGTAMVIFLIAGTMSLFVKIRHRTLLYLSGMALVVGVLGWLFLLKGYQKQRVLTFLDPGRDPLGAGYHIIQSKIAIGSGMLTGKGFLLGTQNALSFLPEQHTDFILSVVAEEWGFLGVMTLLALFLLLLLWGLNIAYRCRDHFGIILSVGIVAMFFWQVFINSGMVMGLLPVVGVPLPLISYGGSSVLTNLMALGLLMNVSMRRFMVD
ncbi:MAG: rod shape-determining protein RodA [Deltaproteobacteria bacterium]|nr:MAG: rod shape-determining protein RodA [Deltaproteobacteria bacterium]